jgi:hypothetical protein
MTFVESVRFPAAIQARLRLSSDGSERLSSPSRTFRFHRELSNQKEFDRDGDRRIRIGLTQRSIESLRKTYAFLLKSAQDSSQLQKVTTQ